MPRQELAGYSVQDLLQEVSERREFFGVLIYANRDTGDTWSEPDDRLFVKWSEALPADQVIRLLDGAIETVSQRPPPADPQPDR